VALGARARAKSEEKKKGDERRPKDRFQIYFTER
jgi:hypothetical protein